MREPVFHNVLKFFQFPKLFIRIGLGIFHEESV